MTRAAIARRRVPDGDVAARCAAGRAAGVAFALAGDSTDREAWRAGRTVALAPRPLVGSGGASLPATIADVEAAVARRRSAGGSPSTGVAVALAYDPAGGQSLPALLAIEVDVSLTFAAGAGDLVARRADGDVAAAEGVAERWADRLSATDPAPLPPPRLTAAPTTSLPRERYLAAVRTVQRHIAAGDIYQANLCQRFDVPVGGDPLGLFDATCRSSPAPRAAYLECGGVAVISASPEVFLDWGADGRIATVPIKGTRPRHPDPAVDRRVAQELVAAEKDRAELLMIVDLERNDLGRVCRTGSVHVTELHALRRWATVHHLVARVEGRLRDGVGLVDILDAAFPGGSITGAPKRRAIEILHEVEPVARGFFTGSLFWFGDDGHTDSSILIRSATIAAGVASVGAGGGIVADSDPEREWSESNHKARTIAAALGFEPEDVE